MKLYEILIPARANDGTRDYIADGTHLAFHGRTLAHVGGYTVCAPVVGAWDSGEKTYHETMVPVRVACSPEQFAAIVVDALATFTDQECIMSYVLSDDVRFTTREEQAEADALAHAASFEN